MKAILTTLVATAAAVTVIPAVAQVGYGSRYAPPAYSGSTAGYGGNVPPGMKVECVNGVCRLVPVSTGYAANGNTGIVPAGMKVDCADGVCRLVPASSGGGKVPSGMKVECVNGVCKLVPASAGSGVGGNCRDGACADGRCGTAGPQPPFGNRSGSQAPYDTQRRYEDRSYDARRPEAARRTGAFQPQPSAGRSAARGGNAGADPFGLDRLGVSDFGQAPTTNRQADFRGSARGAW